MTHDTVVGELKSSFAMARDALQYNITRAVDAQVWIDNYTKLVDDTLCQIYQIAGDNLRRDGVISNKDAPGLALLATGGYGRQELCPQSDIDIAFVPAGENNAATDALVKETFRLVVDVLIDGAGLDVAYAYRPLSDIRRLDPPTRTALCEARFLAGQESLLRQMRAKIYRSWDGVQFLLDVAHKRAAASDIQSSLYAVEPDLKSGSGALRDIHTTGWVASALLQTENSLRELEWRGLMTSAQAGELNAAHDFFLALRVWLHLETGKKSNVLRVEYQNRCAHAFGYKGAGALAAQRLLRDYYRHAENVSCCLDSVLRQLLRGPLPLDQHFVTVSKNLRAAHPYALCNHPELLLVPFVLSQKYGFNFEDELEEQIAGAARLMGDEERQHAITCASFTALLNHPGRCAKSLAAMRARGALQAILPEFAQMLHLAPADPSHQLTVGEHSLYAVRRLGQSWRDRLDNERLFNVWSGVDDIEVLLLATLLHDVGKIDTSAEHSVTGAKLVLQIAERLQWSEERCQRVACLVRWHLLLPRLSRLRDLAAPATVREVMIHIPNVAMLKMLYLLSLADTKAVGERTYSTLDLQNMQELYERTLLAMTQQNEAQVLTDSQERERMIARQRQRVHHEMRRAIKNRIDESTLLRLCQQLPPAYVLNTPLPTMAAHLQLLDQLPREQLLVDWQETGGGTVTEMTVVTYDDATPGLLSKICGVVYVIGTEILAANVHTLRFVPGTEKTENQRHIVLDQLQLGARGRALPETQCARLADKLRAVLSGEESLEKVLSAAGKTVAKPLVLQRLEARNDLSDEHTIITIISENVPELMFRITQAMATLNIDIHTAKIATWAGKAENVFYATRRIPAKITSDMKEICNEKIPEAELRETLDALRKLLEGKSTFGQ